MAPTVLYMNYATQDVYDVLREQLPAGWKLLTLDEDTEAHRLQLLPQADFLFVAHNYVTKDHLKAAPKLRLVQHQGVGYERIDLAACKEAGVPVALCPEGTSIGVAEHTILLILGVYKKLVKAANALTQEGRWLQWALRKNSFELYGKTLGLVGMGRIGREVAQRALAFGAKILFFDPVVKGVPEGFAEGEITQIDTLEGLLEISDIVSLHCPVNDHTRGLMNRARFQQMKEGSILINAARGELVVEDDLLWALQSGCLAGAGLDVLCEEPPSPDHPLIGLENVLITPHIAAGTVDALIQKARFSYSNMQRVLDGQRPEYLLPETDIYSDGPKA